MQRFVNLARIATIAVFLGRAWQHLYWDAPVRALLWDEDWMSPVLHYFGINWSDWITNPVYDQAIQKFVFGTGIWYVLCAIAAGYLSKEKKVLQWIVRIGGISLIFLALLYTKTRFYHVGQFFEYSLQFGSPFILLYAVQNNQLSQKIILWIRWAIALTFICHGLYAYGYYPQPAGYTSMMMNGFFVSQSVATNLLILAGILDFVVGIILISGWKKLLKIALIYCVIWGALTAFGRSWSHLMISDLGTVSLQWMHETVYRFPHFLIPLALYIYLYLDRQNLRHSDEVTVG